MSETRGCWNGPMHQGMANADARIARARRQMLADEITREFIEASEVNDYAKTRELLATLMFRRVEQIVDALNGP